MSDLDKKLDEIIFGDMPKHFMSDDMLAKPEQIKQAFKDAGWRDVMHLEDRAKQGQFVANKRVELLSGQEWYDRFRVALRNKKLEGKSPEAVLMICDAAAQEASGIQK